MLPRLLATALLTLVAGCGGGDDEVREEAETTGAPKVEDPGPIHVHGLGVNPRDKALFIATHTGLFRAPRGKQTAKRVGGRYQDTMGFTVVGPDRFLGSGHPDGREKLPPFLGLIRSTDAGKTWQEVSLMGEVDFHVLEASGRQVYGFGSNYETRRPTFLVSNDGGRRWEERSPPASLVSLAISSDDPGEVVAAVQGGPAPDGLYGSTDAGRSWQPLGKQVGLLASTAAGSLFLTDLDGRVHESGDGRSWREVGDVGGEPAAFDAAGDDLYAALHDGSIKLSEDGGRTWRVRSVPQPTVTGG